MLPCIGYLNSKWIVNHIHADRTGHHRMRLSNTSTKCSMVVFSPGLDPPLCSHSPSTFLPHFLPPLPSSFPFLAGLVCKTLCVGTRGMVPTWSRTPCPKQVCWPLQTQDIRQEALTGTGSFNEHWSKKAFMGNSNTNDAHTGTSSWFKGPGFDQPELRHHAMQKEGSLCLLFRLLLKKMTQLQAKAQKIQSIPRSGVKIQRLRKMVNCGSWFTTWSMWRSPS